MNRRTFLKGVGATLPFIRMLEASAAGTAPLRFVGIFHPHGAASPLFCMRPGETETQFDLRAPDSVLSPFDAPETYGRSFKDKLLVLEGIDLSAAIENGTGGHEAPPSLLTGSSVPKHPSIDQYMAVDRGLGTSTRFTSLVLGVGNAGAGTECISFGAGGAPLTKMIDPRKTFNTVFGGLIIPDDPVARAKAERDRSRGQSVIDFIRGDLQSLQPRLGFLEKRKLDQHLTAVREIEKRLMLLPSGVTCSMPAQPRQIPKLQSFNGGEPYFDEITNLQIDLLAQAMACDLTRFATLWLADLSRGATAGTGITGLPNNCHDELAHRYIGPKGSHFGEGASLGEPATWLELGKQNRYCYSKAARLLQRFSEFDILDDVMVLMSGEMGDPNLHSSRNVPMVIAGGCGGKFRMGRRLKLNDDCPQDRWYCDKPTLVSNNKVLVSIAQAFGLSDVQSYGTATDTGITEGELTALR